MHLCGWTANGGGGGAAATTQYTDQVTSKANQVARELREPRVRNRCLAGLCGPRPLFAAAAAATDTSTGCSGGGGVARECRYL